MDPREERGLLLAATKKFKQKGPFWIVPSQSGSGAYVVDLDPANESCSCPDFETRGQRCKHVYAVTFSLKRELSAAPDGTVTESMTVTATVKKKTYGQNWPIYNLAQTVEQERVAELLAGLCAGIVTPPQTGRGQRRLPLGDMIFAATMKVYGTKSARRTMTDLRGYVDAGYLSRAPHYNSIFNYFEDPGLTPLLKTLIEESASPLAVIEDDFAADATGFSTSSFARWFEERPGGEAAAAPAHLRKKWVKLHLVSGVRTHVVTSVQVTDGHRNDSPMLPELLQATAKRFDMAEVSADKGYLSIENLTAIEAVGAKAYIPFKSNSQGLTGPELWKRMFYYFTFDKANFLKRYHQRSNVETVFAMIKAKFGKNVRSKTDVAQKNEVLFKVLCHNLCVLVQAIYELGIDPVFWQDAAPRKGAAS